MIPTKDAKAAIAPIAGNRIGHLVGWDSEGVPLVDFPGNSSGPLRARTTVALPPRSKEADANGRRTASLASSTTNIVPPIEVLLAFDGVRTDRPIIVGRLDPPQGIEAVVDGKRVEIVGHDEIVLRCGQASITLRRNGRVVVRGTYLETRATGTNRIRGGIVEIN
ncbi:MAG TPA: DUF6484 domain-containing protein [Polyangia bacterium]